MNQTEKHSVINTLLYIEKEGKLKIYIYCKRLSSPFNLGSSAFTLKFKKDSLINPVMCYLKKRFRTDTYKMPTLLLNEAEGSITLNIHSRKDGKLLTAFREFGVELAVFEMDIKSSDYNVEWDETNTTVETVSGDKVTMEFLKYKLI